MKKAVEEGRKNEATEGRESEEESKVRRVITTKCIMGIPEKEGGGEVGREGAVEGVVRRRGREGLRNFSIQPLLPKMTSQDRLFHLAPGEQTTTLSRVYMTLFSSLMLQTKEGGEAKGSGEEGLEGTRKSEGGRERRGGEGREGARIGGRKGGGQGGRESSRSWRYLRSGGDKAGGCTTCRKLMKKQTGMPLCL